jgi:hypothetical protein
MAGTLSANSAQLRMSLPFFQCLDAYAAKSHPKQNWSLLTDRLYRRYLRQDELDEASVLMKSAQEIFASVPSASVDWREMLAAPGASRLNLIGRVWLAYFRSTLKPSAWSLQRSFSRARL